MLLNLLDCSFPSFLHSLRKISVCLQYIWCLKTFRLEKNLPVSIRLTLNQIFFVEIVFIFIFVALQKAHQLRRHGREVVLANGNRYVVLSH